MRRRLCLLSLIVLAGCLPVNAPRTPQPSGGPRIYDAARQAGPAPTALDVARAFAEARQTVLVRQRTPFDCAVAALAMLTAQSYDATLSLLTEQGVDPEPRGITGRQMIDAAEVRGVRLRPVLEFRPAVDRGLLIVALTPDPEDTLYHVVYMVGGWVFDPNLDEPEPWWWAWHHYDRPILFLRAIE